MPARRAVVAGLVGAGGAAVAGGVVLARAVHRALALRRGSAASAPVVGEDRRAVDVLAVDERVDSDRRPWTRERMRSAIPRQLPRADVG